MKKILIVEDNQMAALCAKINVEKLGYSCDIAEDGASALEMFSANYYVMILMDLSLGEGINGYDVAKKIRQLEAQCKREYTPIIALTGHAKEDVYNSCLCSGMDGLLEKPLNPYRSFQQGLEHRRVHVHSH